MEENKEKSSTLDKVLSILFIIVAFAGFIAIAFVGIFIGISSIYTIIKAFTLTEFAGLSIGISIMMFISSLVCVYGCYLIVKAVLNTFSK